MSGAVGEGRGRGLGEAWEPREGPEAQPQGPLWGGVGHGLGGDWRLGGWGGRMKPEPGLWDAEEGPGQSKRAGQTGLWVVRRQRSRGGLAR